MAQLTAETVIATYELIRTLPPFSTWNLPEPDDIGFKVARHPRYNGWCTTRGRGKKRRHVIAISAKTVGHVSTLIATMAHECVHLHMAMTGQDTRGEHNAVFYRLSENVCKHCGFDPKAF